MSSNPSSRSVKIDADERGGWSSDRPRREGGPARPPDISVRCRVLSPTHQLRYSPGSLLMVASASTDEREAFAQRLIDNKASVLSLEKVRALMAGRVPDEQIDAKAPELLQAAAAKRLEAGEHVVLVGAWLDPEERARYARLAAQFRRPRHLILIETKTDRVADDDRAPLNELRKLLDAGELGGEGFHTALRLGGGTASEVRRILFQPEPKDD